ncbi:acyl-CoA dehydrogenase family protein [Streptomyces maremycinicus]|uniref:acyl-CoA dehydrogenase family protein n=1 Tax=Streptomyces maremycinicus TaxID=1679753 RepID=UPI00099BF6CA
MCLASTLLADLKARLEACRYLTWKACDYFDKNGGHSTELSLVTGAFAFETAVQDVDDGMRAIAVAAYATARRPAGFLRDVLAFLCATAPAGVCADRGCSGGSYSRATTSWRRLRDRTTPRRAGAGNGGPAHVRA